MAARRLSDSEKQDLVGRYKAGESTSALAEAFGCSPNTVSRTVKALLPADAYAALKASRQKGWPPRSAICKRRLKTVLVGCMTSVTS